MFRSCNCGLFLFLVSVTASFGNLTVTNNFAVYAPALANGASGPDGIWQWGVTNHVPGHGSDLSIISGTGYSSGLKLAGYFHESHSGYAGFATATFLGTNAPSLPNFDLTFGVHERHDKLELDINVSGKTSAHFIFNSGGTAHIKFTATGIEEYLNGVLQQSRTYASLGWTTNDLVHSFDFKGLHHDNGNAYVVVDNLVTTVPEPSTYALLGIAALGAGFSFWRRRRR
jgi:hypothetical protein